MTSERDETLKESLRDSALEESSEETTLLDLFIIIARYKRFALGLPLLAGIVTAAIALFMQPEYTATTKILPPQPTTSAASTVLGQLGALAGGAGNVLGFRNPGEVYVSMLKSRTVADRLIERFKLDGVYHTKIKEDTRGALQGKTKISLGKDGLINLDFEDSDPERAAAVANAYVEELFHLTGVLAVTEAGQRRLFFEKQLEQVKRNLVKAEVAAREAMDKGGIAMVDAQGRSLVENSARLRAQVAAKEVQINAMRSFATDENPQMLAARQELLALRQQMAKLEGADTNSESRTRREDEHGIRNVALLREVRYNEVLFDLLAKQFEVAKLDEAKEGAVIQVVDKAVVPEQKSGPKRRRLVMIATLGTSALAILLVFVFESFKRSVANPTNQPRISELKRLLGRK